MVTIMGVATATLVVGIVAFGSIGAVGSGRG